MQSQLDGRQSSRIQHRPCCCYRSASAARGVTRGLGGCGWQVNVQICAYRSNHTFQSNNGRWSCSHDRDKRNYRLAQPTTSIRRFAASVPSQPKVDLDAIKGKNNRCNKINASKLLGNSCFGGDGILKQQHNHPNLAYSGRLVCGFGVYLVEETDSHWGRFQHSKTSSRASLDS
jgi:hypothetical protein